jgi:hypothetical protein
MLVALLFVADKTLENGPPPIVTSDRVGLPKPWHPGTIQTHTSAPAPAPDMTSPAILAAQPKSTETPLRIGSAARAARAEASQYRRAQSNYPQTNLFDRFSIKGY